ncbi:MULTISPECIES: dTDP-4-dehydrorhamnose 3,5-epimerase [unclassified Paenibacillus]|uniref:dTDP-4-dehydrorhamnose 3,5-epimerase n=1 Tax=unclassified Paenibacillus TaxID=185978 RepID=UPI0024061673|nr:MULTISPECIES: dTDP-4-dehydrorhamnose 3,5-epimerase [unclassified Paenibacillus]MDF9844040.1 dTDP-4-dehydrorhamnose 3,5-epimerase [Paenibacillus sp. PastF-2]MDF9850645.1 dTDP-4-dehydrorhamnose 3,5-epimerase [Paenibacillus sp. PastM-2]MDF9857204.1 dTDP-4-dehydrorhamnose 3,5-epimerase [Paenibacillus sp. PastF-1]MDH6482495.1 dTDP-4-dehydrorhamnose 3,5-epimerase [Paenibacillus sp. PastH-2]MDH6509902.1 dTDP-4-dehydrorhamnose 3,5-epimerase [Paenibacillus sp. PastM-3]
MNKYEFFETGIEGLTLINPFHLMDERGLMKKTFEINIFEQNNINFHPIEEMETTSKKGVLRGLHFQTSNSQAKLVRCSKGAILDVAVDLRKGSETFGKSFSVLLSSENKKMLYIPRGFAHGCLTVIEDSTFYYLSDNKYYPEYDSGIRWDDKDLNINWEMDGSIEVILSEKDKHLGSFQNFITTHGAIEIL